jgi:hypothetical protein
MPFALETRTAAIIGLSCYAQATDAFLKCEFKEQAWFSAPPPCPVCPRVFYTGASVTKCLVTIGTNIESIIKRTVRSCHALPPNEALNSAQGLPPSD